MFPRRLSANIGGTVQGMAEFESKTLSAYSGPLEK